MVYTKHFFIHSFDHLRKAEDYIKNTGKTTVRDNSTDDHLGNLFPYLINDCLLYTSDAADD